MSGTLLFSLVAIVLPAGDDPSQELLPPVRLEAAGKPIDTAVGHAAPFVCDWDGDGVKDLLVGQVRRGDPVDLSERRYQHAFQVRGRREVQRRRCGWQSAHGLMRRIRSPVGGPRRRRLSRSDFRLLARRDLLLPRRSRSHVRRPGNAQRQERRDH